MSRKEFVRIIEENVMILDRLGERLKIDLISISKYPRQQLTALVRLYLGGRAKLKDIAHREFVTTSNLCATFRRLENDGLVLRTIDENDRRNTWYSVTKSGEELARRAIDKFREGIEIMFKNVNREDEERLTGALKTINELLTNMEISNA
ncbi:MAG: MarR family transcriptional regulator [Alphaproteobacteria bacterium]|nr:MarR family transcriptional regulator [Alphaproteobacteria bacterium]MBN2675512.1 MarR family transcriptional regulator [Alphaproteobacteria bacterium]